MRNRITLTILIGFCSCFLVNAQKVSWEKGLKNKLNQVADSLTLNLKPWKVPTEIFAVENYGAVPDGQTMNTKSIQKAIDACSSSGGGLVRFSKGDYVTGTIELKSNVMLEILKGARILGSTDLKDYPEKIESFKSIMSEYYVFRQSLIYAEKATNIGIQGAGEIYFRGEIENFPGPETGGQIVGRPLGIRMIECKNIVVQDILLKNSASWMQNYVFCEDLIFDRVKVINIANYNNDGLDPDGCKNLIVRNCLFIAEDDAMCFKGASGCLSENLLIENSTFLSTCNAFKIGTDTQGSFRSIVARNLTLGGMPDSLRLLSLKKDHECSTGITLATVDGGNVEDIFISNITINKANCPIFLRIGDRGRVMKGVQKPVPGYLKRIVISNVKGVQNFKQGSLITGIPNHPVEDIVIKNVDLGMSGGGTKEMENLRVTEDIAGYPDAHQFSKSGLPSHGFYIRHAQNILLNDVKISPEKKEERPAFKSGGDLQNTFVNGVRLAQ